MQVREFISVAIYSIFLSLPVQSVVANSRDPAIHRDGKVTVKLDDLVIEVTPPRGRESILNAEPFYEHWENVDDVAYWESIYGSMDNIPPFEDLPEIPGETFELKYVRKSEDENSNDEKLKTSIFDVTEQVIKKSSMLGDERKTSATTVDHSKENNSLEDCCEWINPLLPREKLTSRQKRETTSIKKEITLGDIKRKPRTLLLHGESGKSRLKSAFRSNRRPDYFSNKYGRKNYRSYVSEHGFSSPDDYPENDDIIGGTKSQRFVDSAINAAELVNSKYEPRNTGQVVGGAIANAARQLAQAKHDVIDLGRGGRQAIGLGSLNNAATDCPEEGVNVAEANIDSGLEVVGNSVLDTNSGIINEDIEIADGIKASLDIDTKAVAFDTATGTCGDNDVDKIEIVGANLKEDAHAEAEIASDVVASSNLELVDDEGPKGTIEATENVPQILEKIEAVDKSQVVSTEDYLKLSEITSDVKQEAPIIEHVSNSEAIEEVADTEKLKTEEIVGSTVEMNANNGVQTSRNTGMSTNLETEINIGKSRHYESPRRDFGREDMSCECVRSSEEVECHSREFYPRRYYDKNQVLEDRRDHGLSSGRRHPEDHRNYATDRDDQRIHKSGIHANAGIHTSLDTGIDINSNYGSKSLLAGTGASINLHSNLDIGTSLNSGLRGNSGIQANAGIHTSLDTGINVNSNHGSKSLHAGTASSLDLHSNLDIGASTHSGIHASSGIHKSADSDLEINFHRDPAGRRVGGKSSVDVDSHLDIGRTRSRPYASHYRHYGDFYNNKDICPCEESEEDRGYGRRFPVSHRYQANHPNHHETHDFGIRANAGLRTSIDAGIDINSNHGAKSLHAGAASSLDLHSNLDIGTSNSGLHASSGIHKSSDTNLEINSDRNAGNLYAGGKSSLDVDSHLDIARTRSRPHGSPYRHYGDFYSNEDIYDYKEFENDREYRRRFPTERIPYRMNHRGQPKIYDSGIHANSGTRASLNTGLNVNTDLRTAGVHSDLHANSGIQTSLDAGIELNSDVSASHLSAGSRGSLDIAASRSSIRDGNYRSYDDKRDEDISSEYDEEHDYRRSFLDRHHTDADSYGYSGRKSRIGANSGIRTSLDTGVDINSVGAAGRLRAGAKSSLDHESHLDIGSATLGVNGANRLHLTDAINSRVRASDEIHTYHDSQFDASVGGHLHTDGIKSSLDLDSHLDIATETKRPSGANERSRIQANVNTPNEKLGEKICETACRRISDSRDDTAWPNSRFDDAYDERSEYPGRERLEVAERGEAPPFYVCDNCRRRLYGGMDSSCPICGRLDGRPFEGRRHFLSSGTMYHFDGRKQNFKRTADRADMCGYNHHINLNANCTDEATNGNPDCQGMDYDLQTPRDGNPVPLGFVRTHLSHGHDIALDMHDRARSLVAGGLQPSPHTPSMLNFFHSKVPDDLVKLNEESELTLFGTKLLQQKLSVDYDITPNTFLEFLNHHGFRVTGDRICRGRRKRCGGYDKFRSLDGSCNNFDHPTWGQSNRAFVRILPARYSDGIHGMPVSVKGAELPNPRKLSVRLYSRIGKLDPELTLSMVQWGQTLAHDLARQVMDQTTEGGIECCGNNGKSQLPKSLQHHSCAPISISPRDKFYSSYGQRCMNFVRAMTVTREDCTLGPADQLNGATSFLDCSPMYGVDKTTSDELREFTGGRMKVEYRSGRWMLPTMRNRSNFCDIWTSDDVCYRTGDPRNNQNPQLVILQTLLVREHNRIANGLSALNQDWKDERIFQETRRIVIAEYQHITYNEWLPLLLGKRYCERHGIIRTKHGMSNEYNERVNPSTIIGFTSGAFRSLHSMIDGDLGLCNVSGDFVDNLRLSDHYFRPRVIEKNNNFEHLLRGLTMQRMQRQHMHLHSELTEYLFRSRNDYGMDLAAIDIQRGRDHGVPGYNAYRKICRLRMAQDFDDLSDEISWENIEKLRRDYAHVDDIDLIVGATMENRAPGSHFGPTNRCLIGEQFYRSRVGDKYFYDNEKFPHSFTPEQFDEITKITLSRLMCDMGGAVGVVQRYAFRAISSKNPLVPCEDLPKLDLTHWIEKTTTRGSA